MESFKAAMEGAPAYMLLEQEQSRRLTFPKFCIECGSKNIAQCPKCKKASILMGSKYCGSCGKAMPWTQEALKAAQEITDHSEELTLEQKEELKATFPYLTAESPRSPLEAGRFARLTAKLVPAAKEALLKVLDTVVEQSVKAIISAG